MLFMVFDSLSIAAFQIQENRGIKSLNTTVAGFEVCALHFDITCLSPSISVPCADSYSLCIIITVSVSSSHGGNL